MRMNPCDTIGVVLYDEQQRPTNVEAMMRSKGKKIERRRLLAKIGFGFGTGFSASGDHFIF